MEWSERNKYCKHSEFLKNRWKNNRDDMVKICKLGGKVKNKRRSPISEETKHRISKTLKDKGCHPPWELSPCYKNKGYTHTYLFGEDTTKRIRQAILEYNCNRVLSKDTRIKMSEAKKGELNFNWKGGVKTINEKIRNGLEIKAWRKSVFSRDKYVCQVCGSGIRLNAHHIKSFSEYPELRFEITNGLTLCASCHKKTLGYGGKWNRVRMDRAI